MSVLANTHYLERTSAMGEPFIGRCVLCGATGLPMTAALVRCPNPAGKTADEALIDAIEGPPSKRLER